MNQEQFDEIIDKLEQEKSKYSKEIIINNRKITLLENDQLDEKIIEIMTFSFVSMLIIFLGLLLLNGIGLLPILPIVIPLEAISLITSGTSFIVGSLLQKKLESKRRIKERIKDFSKAKNQSELLQEKIEYTIEEEKYQNKKLIVQTIIDSMIEKQNNINSLSEEYTISKKESNQTMEDIENNINNLNNIIEEKYKELDYLTAYKVIYSNYEKKDNKKFNKEKVLYGVLGGFFSVLICFIPMVSFEKLFLNATHVSSNFIYFIPFILGATGTYIYLKKREDSHAKAFENLKNELEGMDLSNDIEKKYDNGESINKTINKIITEISRLRIELEKEIININSFNNEEETELSKSNGIENSLSIDNQIEKAPIEKGPSLVKKFPYKK